jgi:hypothetical protein
MSDSICRQSIRSLKTKQVYYYLLIFTLLILDLHEARYESIGLLLHHLVFPGYGSLDLSLAGPRCDWGLGDGLYHFFKFRLL